jgi:hypothetical protein
MCRSKIRSYCIKLYVHIQYIEKRIQIESRNESFDLLVVSVDVEYLLSLFSTLVVVIVIINNINKYVQSIFDYYKYNMMDYNEYHPLVILKIIN